MQHQYSTARNQQAHETSEDFAQLLLNIVGLKMSTLSIQNWNFWATACSVILPEIVFRQNNMSMPLRREIITLCCDDHWHIRAWCHTPSGRSGRYTSSPNHPESAPMKMHAKVREQGVQRTSETMQNISKYIAVISSVWITNEIRRWY